MKKLTKKMFGISTSLLLMASFLAGCTASPTNDSSSVDTPKDSSSSTAIVDEKSDFDFSNKPTLKVLMGYMNTDPMADFVAKRVEEMTGYKVEYSLLPAEDPLVKLNAIISSKEDFDLFILTKTDFENTVGTNAYTDITEILPKYAKDLQAKTAPNLWTNVTIDGKIYGVPEATAYESIGSAFRVRTDLLKKAGIENLPTTTDELYTALQALKKAGYIPISANSSAINEVYSAFGLSNDKKWYEVDGKLVNLVEMTKAKDYVTYMNKLFSEGLLDSEWATNTGDAINEKFYTGKSAIYRTAWWSEPTATNTLTEKQPDATTAYLPYLKDENGKSFAGIGRGVGRVMVLPKVSKNKEHVLNFMNVKVADEDVYTKLVIGDEGTHWQKSSDGGFEPILPAFFDDMGNGDKFQTGSISELYSQFWLQTRVKKDPTLYKEFIAIQDNVKTADIYYDYPTFMPPNVEYSKVMPKVNTFAEDAFLQMIVGTRKIEDWDKFIEEWKSSGGQEATDLINTWWEQNMDEVSALIKKSK